ncbi:inositol monophosphatase [Acetobacteraceae bacterium KSS8]|uniref:Inositol monophosphatase n=1 Tax=Endosaccharibacter trunci TaxID=2812733 RepID=A0ABT1W9T8_9PROT|nr:inositol monophosphatase [Acetobacteraceae bacterium KSS8]
MNAPAPSPALLERVRAMQPLMQEAAALAMRMRPPAGAFAAAQKGAQDWVTEADGAVEAFLAARIGEAFPEDGFQGEEGGEARQGQLRWVVDPIDGTSNYARGRPRWCVSLGLLDGNEPVAGMLVAPVLGETFLAVRGGGATLNGAPIRAADTTDPARSMVEIGWGSRVAQQDYLSMSDRIMALGVAPRCGGCGALALADVACGRQDGYVEISINLWDVAAALVLLGETGARVSPFLRDGGLHGAIPILAAAPGVADALSAASGLALA